MSLPFFALTLFVSAFLLFLVQPMIGKMILPRLGGTPQVWNTCMVFFQFTLLLGYAYTHFISTRLKVRTQIFVHGAVLFLPLALFALGTLAYQGTVGGDTANPYEDKGVLSFFYAAKEGLNPIGGGNPIPITLWWLFTIVGLPFFVVATSAPLLQKWFGHTGHPAAEDPYFLYAASNIGSFGALLAYPFVIERILTLNLQSWTWVLGYAVLVALVIGCAFMVMKAPRQVRMAGDPDKTVPPPDPLPQTTKPTEEKETAVKSGPPPKETIGTSFKKGGKQKKKKGKKPAPSVARSTEERKPERRDISKPLLAMDDDSARLGPVTPLRRLRWIALTAVPSSLMLGVTTHITTDLSPIPLLWIIPLMLYLLSFVLVFSRWPVAWTGTPHKVMLIAQPFALILLIVTLVPGVTRFADLQWIMGIHIMAFFLTTMVLHGELAKDRPRTEHLTEFYLMMSVGGVLGGMFNALLAPVVFRFVLEYSLAIFLGALLRPIMVREGLIERLFNLATESKGGRSLAASDASAPAAPYLRDVAFALPVFIVAVALGFTLFMTNFRVLAFLVPLLLTLVLMGRPLRYGLAIGSILLVMGFFTREDRVIYQDRSYYGVIKVVKQGPQDQQYTTLMHGTTNHGQNYLKPSDPRDWGNPNKDFSRLATTYYHRRGPAGVVMEKFNWFSNTTGDWYRTPYNEYWADNRMPASLVGFGFQPMGFGNLPVGNLVNLWSEPPLAVIGLGTGTMAAYAHPFQHLHYYEIDSYVLRLAVPPRFLPQDKREPTDTSLPDDLYQAYLKVPLGSRNATYFNYLADAKRRGVEAWVFMGDARLRMAQPYWEPDTTTKWNNAYSIRVIDGPKGGGPDRFYHMMVVDAFSSDAIPVHLLTKEAMKMYFTKLTEEGILCVHVSNRHLDLVPVVADIANELGYAWKRGNDHAPAPETYRAEMDDPENKGRSISTWVMVARKPEYFESTVQLPNGRTQTIWRLDEPPGYSDRLRAAGYPAQEYWKTTPAYGRYLWTDDFSNLIAVFEKEKDR